METDGTLKKSMQDFFDAIVASKGLIMPLKEKMLNAMDLFLKMQSKENLVSVKAILDDAEETGLYELDAEMVRYRRIFDILMSEAKKGYILFSDSLCNHTELMERYILCIFALRRIEFDKEEKFTEEGIQMLKNCHISETAIHKICETEIFAKTEKIYAVLAERGIL